MVASTTVAPVTAPEVRARKGGAPLVMVTSYDAPTARIADEAGVDLILVGYSVAMAVLGYDDTLQVTVDDLVHHTGAVARAKPRALIVTDLPWLSYHTGRRDAVPNAGRLIRAGAGAPDSLSLDSFLQILQRSVDQPAFRLAFEHPEDRDGKVDRQFVGDIGARALGRQAI